MTQPKLPLRLAVIGDYDEELATLYRMAGKKPPEPKIARDNDGSFIVVDSDGQRCLVVPPSRPKKRSEPYDFSDPAGLDFARWVIDACNARGAS